MWHRVYGGAAVTWPYALAVVLALAALAEVATRTMRDPGLPLVLVLALAATLPVALVRADAPIAVALTGTATVFGLFVGVRPPVAASVVAVAVTVCHELYRVVRRLRAHAVERDVTDRTVRATLLEHAARGERARIARELHDVVAHHISMIAVQAEAARLTTPGMPAEGARRLVAIGDTARSALTEMRRLLGVLREDAADDDPLRPQPGLAQLTELLDEARGLSGASTRLIVRGRVGALDPGVELTAYRIVQEALTNVRRHAAGAAVDVDLDYRHDTLRLRVRDNGPGPGAEVAGHGLAGMRERAAMVGGRVTSGAAPIGGFLVEALLPRSTRPPSVVAASPAAGGSAGAPTGEP